MHFVDKNIKGFLKERFLKISYDELFHEDEEKWSHPLYNLFFLSVFDHWLTEKEAEPEIFCYSQIEKKMSQKDDQEVQVYFKREKRLLTFYQNLYNSHQVFEYKEAKSNAGKFYYFDSVKEYEEKCLQSIREKNFLKLCIPEVGMVLEGNFDLTHIVILDKNCSIDKVKDLATSCGLFILS